jgi:hypothetical protein
MARPQNPDGILSQTCGRVYEMGKLTAGAPNEPVEKPFTEPVPQPLCCFYTSFVVFTPLEINWRKFVIFSATPER